MKIALPEKLKMNVPMLLKQMGYHPILDRRAAQESWVRNLGRGHYPRFHLYPEKNAFNMHLDQKQNTINLKGLKRHAGEYDGPVVEAEGERIKRWIDYAQKK
ncbi:MAG: hypothetical protein Q8P90_04045 [bacterium]|nr:hypothetical protein [bacterium]